MAPSDHIATSAHAAGFATLAVPVPAHPALLGSQWFFQAAALPPAGLRLSAALRVVVGS